MTEMLSTCLFRGLFLPAFFPAQDGMAYNWHFTAVPARHAALGHGFGIDPHGLGVLKITDGNFPVVTNPPNGSSADSGR